MILAAENSTKSEHKSCNMHEKKTREQTTDEFVGYTTIHGMNHWLNKDNSSTRRICYFLIWLLFTGITFYQAHWNIRDYLKYETKISSDIIYANSLNFPSITICPENAAKKSIAGGSKLLLDELERFYSMTRRSGGINQCYDPKLPDFFPNFTIYLHYLNESLHDNNEPGVYPLMIRLQEMFLECDFKSVSVNCAEMLMSHTATDAFLCYTFNYANFAAHAYKLSTRSGIFNGLRLLLSVEMNETCVLISGSTNGFYLNIHDPNVIPLYARDDAILLAPGTRTEVSLTQKVIDTSATEDLGRCKTDYPLYMFPNNSYVQDNCMQQCLAEEIWATCGCVFSSLMLNLQAAVELLKKHGPVRQKISNKVFDCMQPEEYECMMDYLFYYRMQGGGRCNSDLCPVACHRTEYFQKVSSVPFPVNQIAEELIKTTKFSTVQEIRENLLEVDVFFQSLTHELVTETRAMTLIDLLSNIGGTLGLYLGASFLTAIEVLEFVSLWLMRK